MDWDAIKKQLDGIVIHVGREWTFGTSTFAAVSSVLRPDDPRMVGSTDRLIELTIATEALPDTPPAAGDALLDAAGRTHRIVRTDDSPHGLTSILVTA
jgi:hypothetical protein